MIVCMSVESNVQLKRFCEPGVETAPPYIKRGQKVMEHMRCDLCRHCDRFCSNISIYCVKQFYTSIYIKLS